MQTEVINAALPGRKEMTAVISAPAPSAKTATKNPRIVKRKAVNGKLDRNFRKKYTQRKKQIKNQIPFFYLFFCQYQKIEGAVPYIKNIPACNFCYIYYN